MTTESTSTETKPDTKDAPYRKAGEVSGGIVTLKNVSKTVSYTHLTLPTNREV